MNDSKEYSLEELIQEIQPPYQDQAHLANMLDTLAIYLERPWREHHLPDFFVPGFQPLIQDFLQVSQDVRENLVECLSYLFDPYDDDNHTLDITNIKNNMQCLSPAGLVVAINLIANERAPDAEARIRPYLNHEIDSVRETAKEQLLEMGSPV